MMTPSFKMRTLEDLISKIRSSGIQPMPDVEVLDYIYDWKLFVLDKLT